eukprot:4509293-Amphidinium_carterae.2
MAGSSSSNSKTSMSTSISTSSSTSSPSSTNTLGSTRSSATRSTPLLGVGQTTVSSRTVSSSSSLTSTTTSTTVTWMVVAGSYWFRAAGVEVPEVRRTCITVLANVTAVNEERLECIVSLSEELRQLQVESETVQSFLVSFVISVQQEQEASVQADLDAIAADNASSFAVILEEALSSAVENASLLEQSFAFRQYDVIEINNAMEMFLLKVKRLEAKALAALLESNNTFIALDLGDGSTAVAARLSGKESHTIQVSEAVTVTVPVELLDTFEEEELALVVLVLADSVAALTQTEADDVAQQDDVEISIAIT